MEEIVKKVRVWNDHTEPYTEKFRDVTLTIGAKKFIEMEEPEAVKFMGTYTPIKRDGQGNDLNPKKLRLERIEPAQEDKPSPQVVKKAA